MARRRSRAQPLEQLAMELGPPRSLWTFSRLVLRSPHRARIRERLDFVRAFFPELERVTVRVGLVRRPGILGWGSLDPDQPGIWVRPRRLDHFTIAHELTHLLQARGLVPGGEKACDLWALARSPLLVDHPPCYLAIPRALRRLRSVSPRDAQLLHGEARAAIEARAAGERTYLRSFERAIAERWRPAAPSAPTVLARALRLVALESGSG